MKIVTVVGARPQFIKASALSRCARNDPAVEEIIVHTGQHYDDNMSDVFFRELDITRPRYSLGVQASLHGAMTGRQLAGIETVLLDEKPDVVVVYGDTNSTLAGALAAVKLHIPVAHIEAGLRSFNRRMPEEVNRVLTDHVSRLLFTPTDAAVAHLAREGISGDRVVPSGDIMYDVALFFGKKAEQESSILADLGLTAGGYAIATIHRAENTNEPERLAIIMQALVALAGTMPVVLPLHPRTRGILRQDGKLEQLANALTLIDPVGYLDMTALVKNARLAVTDSGGLQKEAYFHGVQAVTLRSETEWTELLELGVNRLPRSFDAQGIAAAIQEGLSAPFSDAQSPYGNGRSAGLILAELKARFG